MHAAIEAAIGNTRLEYPDWEPDEDWLRLVNQAVEGTITFDEAVAELIRLHY